MQGTRPGTNRRRQAHTRPRVRLWHHVHPRAEARQARRPPGCREPSLAAPHPGLHSLTPRWSQSRLRCGSAWAGPPPRCRPGRAAAAACPGTRRQRRAQTWRGEGMRSLRQRRSRGCAEGAARSQAFGCFSLRHLACLAGSSRYHLGELGGCRPRWQAGGPHHQPNLQPLASLLYPTFSPTACKQPSGSLGAAPPSLPGPLPAHLREASSTCMKRRVPLGWPLAISPIALGGRKRAAGEEWRESCAAVHGARGTWKRLHPELGARRQLGQDSWGMRGSTTPACSHLQHFSLLRPAITTVAPCSASSLQTS